MTVKYFIDILNRMNTNTIRIDYDFCDQSIEIYDDELEILVKGDRYYTRHDNSGSSGSIDQESKNAISEWVTKFISENKLS